MLNAKYLIGDIQERARERKLSTLKQNKPFSSAEPNGETKDDIRFDSAKSKRKQEQIQNIDKTPKTNQFDTPVHENKELAELASVIKTAMISKVQIWTLLIQMIVYYLIKVIKLRGIIMTLYTRAFEEKDLSQIKHLLQLYYELGYPTTSENLITRLSKINNNKDYYMLLLLKNDKIIGFSGMCKMTFYEKDGDYMRILAFVINSKFRKRGYGKKLLADSEELARRLNCKVITLNSGNRNERLIAHKLYINSGYTNHTIGFSKDL